MSCSVFSVHSVVQLIEKNGTAEHTEQDTEESNGFTSTIISFLQYTKGSGNLRNPL